MLELFENPPAEYRPTPFWFWNSNMDRNEIERQIREMHAKGLGGFFIHGRFGLKTEYLSDEWMDCIERACRLAKELGMFVWLYDENPFPSGVGGGEVMKDIRHHSKFLDYLRMEALSGHSVEMSVDSEHLVSAAAVNEETGESVDLTEMAKAGAIAWTAPKGAWEILVIYARTAYSSEFIYGSEPDYFEPTMMPAFLRHTHERYASRLEQFFGDPIIGIFTDEPKMQCIYHQHEDANTSAWFDSLPEEFEKDHGYDLLPNLPALFADVGGDAGHVRRDYWSTLSRVYIERYFEPYRRWCERNNLVFTGHLFLEEGLYANTMYQGDFPGVLREFNMPGVDHLAMGIEGDYAIRHVPKSITRTHGNKIAASGAHITGSNRILSETFGCCGWGLTMEQMKWIVDWQYTLGVNFLCPHAFYYSIAGARKTDAPPSQFYQATFWPHYRLFADYVARLSYALSQGRHSAQIALLYPMSSFRSEWTPGRVREKDALISGFFDMYCRELMRRHLDYDVITEEDLARATVHDGNLSVGDEKWELLVLPPLTVVEAAAADRIREFATSGGAVLASVSLPTHTTEGEPLDDLARALEADRCRLIIEQDPSREASQLRRTVEQLIIPRISVRVDGEECADINCVHRVTNSGGVFFFANGADETRDTVVILKNATGVPQVWDPETGQSVRLPTFIHGPDGLAFHWRFPPRGSLLLTTSPSTQAAPTPPAQDEEWLSIPIHLADEWDFMTEEPNVLPLRDWNLHLRTFETRLRYTYTTNISLEFVPDRLWLLLDDLPPVGQDTGNTSSRCSVTVNGRELVPEEYECFIDIGFQKLDIRPLVEAGENEIVIRIDHEGWAGEPKLMPAEPRLLGDFALERSGDIWKIVPPKERMMLGSWTDQGYPFFSGTGIYSQTVGFSNVVPGGKAVLHIDDAADMVEIWVNGYRAGVRPWKPLSVDVSDIIVQGENLIVLQVINSLENTLLGEQRKSGLLGKVWIEASWETPEQKDEDSSAATDSSLN